MLCFKKFLPSKKFRFLKKKTIAVMKIKSGHGSNDNWLHHKMWLNNFSGFKPFLAPCGKLVEDFYWRGRTCRTFWSRWILSLKKQENIIQNQEGRKVKTTSWFHHISLGDFFKMALLVVPEPRLCLNYFQFFCYTKRNLMKCNVC